MIICKVTGSIVSTIKNPNFEGKKLMIVQPLDFDGSDTGDAFLALDTVSAGVGDRVLINKEGGSARIIFDNSEIPVQAVIVAVIDEIDLSPASDSGKKEI